MHTMAKYIARSSTNDAVMAVGDFNCVEDEPATEIFLETSGLADSYREMFPDRISNPGFTNDTPGKD